MRVLFICSTASPPNSCWYKSLLPSLEKIPLFKPFLAAVFKAASSTLLTDAFIASFAIALEPPLRAPIVPRTPLPISPIGTKNPAASPIAAPTRSAVVFSSQALVGAINSVSPKVPPDIKCAPVLHKASPIAS